MSCDGGHLGFPIGIKNSNLVKDIPMIIPLQFGFSQFISFGEEDLWNFSQSEHIIGPGSHIEYPTGTKNSNFVEDHPRNIPAKFGSNRPSGFGEEAWNVKSLQTTDDRRQTTDDGRQVMAIVHMDLWSRWTKKDKQNATQKTKDQATWTPLKTRSELGSSGRVSSSCSTSGTRHITVQHKHLIWKWCWTPVYKSIKITLMKHELRTK